MSTMVRQQQANLNLTSENTKTLKKDFETTVDHLMKATEYSKEVEHDLDTEKKRSKSLIDQFYDTSIELSKSRDTCVKLTEELATTEGTNSLSCINSSPKINSRLLRRRLKLMQKNLR